MPYLLTLAWALSIIYATIPALWLLIHPFAERWRASKLSPAKSIGLLWVGLMLLYAALTSRWRHIVFYDTLYDAPGAWFFCIAFSVLGAWTYFEAGGFGLNNLIGRTELDPNQQQELVTSGIHSRSRHPIYRAHLLMLTGWTIGSGLAVNYILWAVAIFTGFFMIWAEDAELERRFGDEFREYKRQVPALWSRRLPYSTVPPPETQGSVFAVFESLVNELPPGSAMLSPNRFGAAVITPTNKDATEIWGYAEAEGFIVGAGDGPWHEHLDTADEVRSLCRWIMAGNLKLKIMRRGFSIASATLVSDEDVVHGTFLPASLNIFGKKTVEIKSYAPYAPGLEPASKSD